MIISVIIPVWSSILKFYSNFYYNIFSVKLASHVTIADEVMQKSIVTDVKMTGGKDNLIKIT